MTYFEKINELKETVNLDLASAKEDYLKVEAELVSLLASYIKDARIMSTFDGKGNVTETSGETLDSLIVTVAFANSTKKYSFINLMQGNKFVKFEDILEIGDAFDEAFLVHKELSNKLAELEATARAVAKEAAKKEARIKSAEASYDKRMAKALKDFEEFVSREVTVSKEDDFYFALGWLANHMGVLTAKLPDYLGSSFEKHFGVETPKILVDGRAKTSGGYAKQWSWEFKCTINKLKNTTVPACIQHVTTDFSKGIHNTAFLWDLVANYGFQFGKKHQDVDLIADCIPAKYIASFEAGLIA